MNTLHYQSNQQLPTLNEVNQNRENLSEQFPQNYLQEEEDEQPLTSSEDDQQQSSLVGRSSGPDVEDRILRNVSRRQESNIGRGTHILLQSNRRRLGFESDKRSKK